MKVFDKNMLHRRMHFMKTITIIGAWAAGIMTAATILEWCLEGYHIHLFDKNQLSWRKVALSGWGRCNLTTGIDDKKMLLSKYTRGSAFIKKVLGRFSPERCRIWFESHGLVLKIEEDNRVFPFSDDWEDVVDVFEYIFAKYRDNISLHYGEGVSVVNFQEKYLITTTKRVYESDILVITTGWNAYSKTGSSGDGYAFAKTLWHAITTLGPSLSSFLTKDTWTHTLSGLRLEDAKIGDYVWSLLFTHFGISGPLAFMVSSELAWEDISKEKSRSIWLIPIASMDSLLWDAFLREQFSLHPKKILQNILSEKLPRRFVEAFITEFFPEIQTTFASSISREQREKIVLLLGKWIPLTLMERRPWDEFVTAGWVDTDEVNPETLESRIQKNLYFAGEVLNVDAVTGGFNLQACWAGWYAVGKDILAKLIQKD